MLRRAVSAAVAALALAGLALPATLLAQTGPAAAATSQDAAASRGPNSPVVVAITGMNPQWATPRSVITVAGSLTNTSRAPVSGWVVQLYASATQLTSTTQIAPGTAPYYDLPGIQQLPGVRWRSGHIQPGQSVRWQIRFRARKVGMTRFGVYPLAAVAHSAAGTVLGANASYLPYVPAKKRPYASTRPAREQISWLWPLIDKPMLGLPWQNVCKGPQAAALARSLGPGGRLANLVAVGQRAAATATTAARAAGTASGSAQGKSARGQQAESLAGMAGVTWAVDPALLADAKALTTCRSTAPGLAQAAAAWLASVSSATARQPLFAVPYGDPNVAALIRQNHQSDVKNAFRLGRSLASRILRRDLAPAESQPSGSPGQTAGTAWLAGGNPGYGTIENLAGVQIRVRTVVLSRSALPQAHGTVVQTPNGGGSYSTLLLTNDNLGALLGSTGSAPGSAFATSQAFLAETALLATLAPGQPIVVAPPARWSPPASLATRVLAETASAPWLSPVSLTALANRSSIPNIGRLPESSSGQPSYPRKELSQLKVVGRRIYELVSIQAVPNPDLYLAMSAIESSAWDGKSRATAEVMLTALANTVAHDQGNVQIVAGKAGIRITLGGLKGSVPVSIDNRYGFAIKVRMRLSYGQDTGVKIVEDPAIVTIPARTPRTIKLHVQAAAVGSTTITMRLESPRGQLLPSKAARMTVQATQVGVLGMIIFAAALGVFLIASAARAVHRGRAVPAGTGTSREGAKSDGMGSDQAGKKVPDGERAPSDVLEGGEMAGQPATVVPEHSELGAAGPPGL
ncbi:MAG: DUF6049 family protein [Streptosporangiaceae bacterium]